MSWSFYILDENYQLAKADLPTWAKWCARSDKSQLCRTRLKNGVEVTTVFLGYTHLGSGLSRYFETLVEGGPYGGYQQSYATWQEALAGHQEVVERLK